MNIELLKSYLIDIESIRFKDLNCEKAELLDILDNFKSEIFILDEKAIINRLSKIEEEIKISEEKMFINASQLKFFNKF